VCKFLELLGLLISLLQPLHTVQTKRSTWSSSTLGKSSFLCKKKTLR